MKELNLRKMLNKQSFAIIALGSMLVAFNPRGLAQVSQPGSARKIPQGSTANPEQLSRQFRDGFLKGCQNGVTPGVKNQPSYCSCLVKAYQSRYDGQTLAAISQLASRSGTSGPALVNLMIAPESKQCASTN
jgi:hypothetical protein